MEKNDVEKMLDSDLYQSASLAEKMQIMINMKHYSLESGCDANVELVNRLIPEAIKALKSGSQPAKEKE